MAKLIDIEDTSSQSARRHSNNPLTERTRYGTCVRCNSRFTWTGSIPEVPACGNCGRQHTEEDFKKFQAAIAEQCKKNEIQGKDKDEVEITGSMRDS